MKTLMPSDMPSWVSSMMPSRVPAMMPSETPSRSIRLLPLLACLTACTPTLTGTPEAPPPAVDDPLTWALPAYAAACRELVGAVPSFDCFDGTVAAITVDGQTPDRYTPGMTCDRPALLPPGPGEKTDGQCVPYGRALVLADDDTLQIAAFCRQKLIRPAESPLYDEIDVIAHSVTRGYTCWFQAKADNPAGSPDVGLDGRRVPSPTLGELPPGYPEPTTFWRPPRETAGEDCGGCHDNDPFYYSPYVAQTGALPADPFGKYRNDIGPMTAWAAPVSLEPRGNTCIGCHRIGKQHTCGEGLRQAIGATPITGLDTWGRAYPQSHWMPVGNIDPEPKWHVVYDRAVVELTACCQDPTGPACNPRPIE